VQQQIAKVITNHAVLRQLTMSTQDWC